MSKVNIWKKNQTSSSMEKGEINHENCPFYQAWAIWLVFIEANLGAHGMEQIATFTFHLPEYVAPPFFTYRKNYLRSL